MRTWFTLVNLVGLFCLLVIMNTIYTQLDKYNENYNEQRLAKSVEYASEAAFLNSIGTKDNNISYTDNLSVFLNSQDTLNVFDTMMELNYDLSICDASNLLIEDSIGVAVLACNDGFYLTRLAETMPDQYRLYWTPKLPYCTEITGDTYSVCLNTKEWMKVQLNSVDGTMKITSGDKYSDYQVAGILTQEVAQRVISKTLTDSITKALDDNAFLKGENEFNLYIPSEQTLSGINSIQSPSFLIIIREAGYAGCKGTQNAAITGLKVTRKIRTIGYVDTDGEKKYCYEFQGASARYDILEYFNSTEEAALAGYSPDYAFIFNMIENK